MLRKKLLLLTKSLSEKKSNSKQQIQAINNQELNDLVYFYNKNILNTNSSNLNEPQFDMDIFMNAVKTNELGKLNSQIYQFQQSTIDHLEAKIEKLNNLNNQLLIDSAAKDTDLEACKKELKLKVKKI